MARRLEEKILIFYSTLESLNQFQSENAEIIKNVVLHEGQIYCCQIQKTESLSSPYLNLKLKTLDKKSAVNDRKIVWSKTNVELWADEFKFIHFVEEFTHKPSLNVYWTPSSLEDFLHQLKQGATKT